MTTPMNYKLNIGHGGNDHEVTVSILSSYFLGPLPLPGPLTTIYKLLGVITCYVISREGRLGRFPNDCASVILTQ